MCAGLTFKFKTTDFIVNTVLPKSFNFQFIQKLFGFLQVYQVLDSVNHLYMALDLCIVMTEQKTALLKLLSQSV